MLDSRSLKANYTRLVFWSLWFVVVPLGLALLTVMALIPEEGNYTAGAIRVWVREQKVPAVIVLFTAYELILHRFRHSLPLARHFSTQAGAGLSREMRKSYEHALQLIEETERIFKKRKRAVSKEVDASDVERIRSSVEELRSVMSAEPLDEPRFHERYERLGELSARHLGRWQRGELREYTESILVAVGAALLLRAFVVEAFKIPSGSMLPTLQIHDHIFVNKFAYGPTVPFTGTRLYDGLPPKRGDVMVFEFPDPNPRTERQDFIKRAIALPEDKLVVKNGHPVINDWEVPHCLVGRYEGTQLFVEYLNDYAYLTSYDGFLGDDAPPQGPYRVKPGEVWVLGDNRNNSHDSRAWNNGRGGGVPFANIKGRAMFVWLSFREGGAAWDITWSRLFTDVLGTPELPEDAPQSLRDRLEQCLAGRPQNTVAPEPQAARERF